MFINLTQNFVFIETISNKSLKATCCRILLKINLDSTAFHQHLLILHLHIDIARAVRGEFTLEFQHEKRVIYYYILLSTYLILLIFITLFMGNIFF